MRRSLIAFLWITGATVPLLAATLFLFGCCVLPFHRVMHELMPLCDIAADVMRGTHEHDATPSTPAPEKDEPVKRIAGGHVRSVRIAAPAAPRLAGSPAPARALRSFITLGAVRCDQDVGLHVLDATFRI